MELNEDGLIPGQPVDFDTLMLFKAKQREVKDDKQPAIEQTKPATRGRKPAVKNDGPALEGKLPTDDATEAEKESR